MAVTFAAVQVFDHGKAHRLGRPKTEGTGITDIQGNNFVTTPLHFVGAIGEMAANLVADVFDRLAG
jgi:hypothetical protein